MLHGTNIAVCSEINRRHINTVWEEYKILASFEEL